LPPHPRPEASAKYRPHVTAYALPVQHLVSLAGIERARRRLRSVDGEGLRKLSRQADRYVITVAGGRDKVEAVRGALRGRGS